MIAVLLMVSVLGSAALDAVRQGLGPEMAEMACQEKVPYGCESAVLAKKDPDHFQRVLEDIITEAQRACQDDKAIDQCDMLRDMDATAEKVLAKHHFERT